MQKLRFYDPRPFYIVWSLKMIPTEVAPNQFSHASESFKQQITVCMFQTVVPEEETVVQRDLLCSLQHQLHYYIKLTTKVLSMWLTYLLEVDTFLGLISQLLKDANHSSHGAAA